MAVVQETGLGRLDSNSVAEQPVHAGGLGGMRGSKAWVHGCECGKVGHAQAWHPAAQGLWQRWEPDLAIELGQTMAPGPGLTATALAYVPGQGQPAPAPEQFGKIAATAGGHHFITAPTGEQHANAPDFRLGAHQGFVKQIGVDIEADILLQPGAYGGAVQINIIDVDTQCLQMASGHIFCCSGFLRCARRRQPAVAGQTLAARLQLLLGEHGDGRGIKAAADMGGDRHICINTTTDGGLQQVVQTLSIGRSIGQAYRRHGQRRPILALRYAVGADHQHPRRPQFAYGGEKGHFRRNILHVAQMLGDGGVVEGVRHLRVSKHGADIAGEDQALGAEVKVEGRNANLVAGADQFVCGFVPDGESEIAEQMAGAVLAPGLIGGQNQLCIAACR